MDVGLGIDGASGAVRTDRVRLTPWHGLGGTRELGALAARRADQAPQVPPKIGLEIYWADQAKHRSASTALDITAGVVYSPPPDCRRTLFNGESMTKDLGNKFTCYKCSTKFYDLKKPAPVCPKCGADQREAPPPKSTERKRSAPRPEPVVAEVDDEAVAKDKEAEGEDEAEEEEEEDDEP